MRDFSAEVRDFSPSMRDFSLKMRDFLAEVRDFSPSMRDFTAEVRDFTAEVRDFTPSMRDFSLKMRDFSLKMRATHALTPVSTLYPPTSIPNTQLGGGQHRKCYPCKYKLGYNNELGKSAFLQLAAPQPHTYIPSALLRLFLF